MDEVAAYADRLAALLPEELSVVMFVNSGSEANDVAIQIARAVTGNRGAVITEHAYHGTTAATAALSPEELGPGGARALGGADRRRSHARVAGRGGARRQPRSTMPSRGCARRATARRS